MFKHNVSRMPTFLMLFALVACSKPAIPADMIELGFSQADVKAILGEPSMVQEFEMPLAPFFGPQELLVDIAVPGAPILEWVYKGAEDVLYIWFSAGPGWQMSTLRVIVFATFPKGAVF